MSACTSYHHSFVLSRTIPSPIHIQVKFGSSTSLPTLLITVYHYVILSRRGRCNGTFQYRYTTLWFDASLPLSSHDKRHCIHHISTIHLFNSPPFPHITITLLVSITFDFRDTVFLATVRERLPCITSHHIMKEEIGNHFTLFSLKNNWG
jgi:hypothetical protein